MAAHLARHMNTTHGAKPAVKAAAKKAAGRKPRRPRAVKRATAPAQRRARPIVVDEPPILKEMLAYRDNLLTQRDRLAEQIDAIEAALSALGTAPRSTGKPATAQRSTGKSAFRTGSLKSYIADVMSGAAKPMAVKDITAAVLKAGFKTSNKTLAKSVGIALTQMPKVKKVSRGLFRMR